MQNKTQNYFSTFSSYCAFAISNNANVAWVEVKTHFADGVYA